MRMCFGDFSAYKNAAGSLTVRQKYRSVIFVIRNRYGTVSYMCMEWKITRSPVPS